MHVETWDNIIGQELSGRPNISFKHIDISNEFCMNSAREQKITVQTEN